MLDKYKKRPFIEMENRLSDIGDNEKKRVEGTLYAIPKDWNSLIDVGCGDGRITNNLMSTKKMLIGVDWVFEGVKHFKGMAVVADIREVLPFNNEFDGSLCSEVIEHLPKKDLQNVIMNLEDYSRKGYVISVPAREPYKKRLRICQKCNKEYHIYGHLHYFDSFTEVDELIGRKSTERIFIPDRKFRGSYFIHATMLEFGIFHEFVYSVCPYCGYERTPCDKERTLLEKLFHKLLIGIDWLISHFRKPMGWFILLYEKDLDE